MNEINSTSAASPESRLAFSLRPLLVRAARVISYPWSLYEMRRRPPSRWSYLTRRSIGIVDPRRDIRSLILLALLERSLELPGDVAECGVFQGHTAVAMGLMLKERASSKRLYALDSYSGFDETAGSEAPYLPAGITNPLLKAGAFSATSLDLVEWKIRTAGLDRIVLPVKGYFRDTLHGLPDRQYSFVHLDCDLAESYRECLEYFYPRMSPGGYIVFDEYRIISWPLTTKAIDEFLGDKPETPTEVIGAVKGRTHSRWHIRKVGGAGDQPK